MDWGTLAGALIGAVGGAGAAGIGNVLRTRSTGRTAARLVYAELTRNAAAVAYYCAMRSWPSVGSAHQAWDAHGEALARMRGAEVFDAIYRGYAALEAVAFIAGDASLAAEDRDELLGQNVAQLRDALRVAGQHARIPQRRLDAELERLTVATAGPRPAPALATAPPSLLTQLIDIQLAAGQEPPPELEAAADAEAPGAGGVARPGTGGARPAPDTIAHPGAILRVYDAANHGFPLPKRLPLVRGESDPPVADAAVNEVFDAMAATHAFYLREFGRNSLDGNGMPIEAVVHFESSFNNSFWDGTRLIVGDGDGRLFQRFSAAVDVLAHELSHVLTQATPLSYSGQAGALTESVCDVMGILVKQWKLGQFDAEKADWVLGRGLLIPGLEGAGLRSLEAPGTAYDNATLGKDPQPAHMRDYVKTENDSGGVHINCGIPNHAFYRLATVLGGPAWERAGRIWYAALTSQALTRTMTFAAFAGLTAGIASRDYGAESEEASATHAAWRAVGVIPRLSQRAAGLVGAQPA